MNIVWNVIEENKEFKISLVYNMYIGTKKLFVDDVETLKVKGFRRNKIAFKHNDKDYNIQLVPEGYGYTGLLTTPEGEKIASTVSSRRKNKTALWIIPFVIINMSIPIVSIEALTPWIIGIVTSFITAKVSQGENLSLRSKLLISIIISIIAWFLYYEFYLIAREYSVSKELLPFKIPYVN